MSNEREISRRTGNNIVTYIYVNIITLPLDYVCYRQAVAEELQEQRGENILFHMGMVYIMHILYVEEGVREDYQFVSKVIPLNSIRLLNLIGEGMHLHLSITM